MGLRETVISRGYSPQHVDQWTKDHPNDEGRMLTAFPTQSGGGGGGGSTMPHVGGPKTGGGFQTPSSPAAAGLAGLQAAAGTGGAPAGTATTSLSGGPPPAPGPAAGGDPSMAMASMTPGLGAASGGVVGMGDLGGAGLLRQGMGNRIYPIESAALAGLRKAY